MDSQPGQTPLHNRFVLHPSVSFRWWGLHLPHAQEANRFYYEKLLTGQATILAPEGIERLVLSELAKDLGPFQLVPSIAGALFTDVLITFNGLARFGILQLESSQELARPAFLMATFYGITFEDALFVVLAEGAGNPLLIADEGLRDRLISLETERTDLRVVWLPDIQEP